MIGRLFAVSTLSLSCKVHYDIFIVDYWITHEIVAPVCLKWIVLDMSPNAAHSTPELVAVIDHDAAWNNAIIYFHPFYKLGCVILICNVDAPLNVTLQRYVQCTLSPTPLPCPCSTLVLPCTSLIPHLHLYYLVCFRLETSRPSCFAS